MHQSRFQTKKYGEVAVNHNGDWSGEAIIVYNDPYDGGKLKRVEIPCALFIALGGEIAAEALRNHMISALESWQLPPQSSPRAVERWRCVKCDKVSAGPGSDDDPRCQYPPCHARTVREA